MFAPWWKFSTDAMMLALEAQEWMKREFEKAGFVYLEAFEWGFRAMTNNARPITTPDDVKGLRMRTPPELALQAVYQALDASPQAINYQETYVALATKTVDGQCNPLSNIHAAKFYEVQKYSDTPTTSTRPPYCSPTRGAGRSCPRSSSRLSARKSARPR